MPGWNPVRLSERIGVLSVQAFGEIEEKLARAEGLADELAAGWEAFQFIVMVADHYSRLTSEQFAMWMFAIPPASDGRDYVGGAPSMRRNPAPCAQLPDLTAVGEDNAADGLAAIAGTLMESLQAMKGAASNQADVQACARAAETAASVRNLLAASG